MAGIYLHIPFCKQACTYCNFHFTTSLRYKDDLIKALIKELEAENGYLEGETINTIYFGGGTPSLLDIADSRLLMQAIHQNYAVARDAEVTLEANPDDITTDKLQGWKDSGINRLSIGVQSFFEEELQWMHRAHNSRQATQSIEWSQGAGFENMSIDLIYGSPLLSDAMWKQNVDRAVGLGIPHLSCYALTVEEKTPLSRQIKTNLKTDIDPDKQARQFLLLMQWLREKGYEHYEVSNFALHGKRSRHNSSYWKSDSYLGIGPSAHSYNGVERRWNIANNTVYINNLKEGLPARETEYLTPVQRLNEYIMISLRTMEGLDLKIVENNFGANERNRIQKGLYKFTSTGLAQQNDSSIQLTDEGMLRADGVASELFAPGFAPDP